MDSSGLGSDGHTNVEMDLTVPKTDEIVPDLDETVSKTDETVPKLDETVQKTDETVPNTDETVPKTDKTGLTMDETVRMMNETGPTMNETGPTMDETGQTMDETVPKMDEPVPKTDETGLTTDESVPKTDETVPKMDETMPKPFICGLCQDVYSELDVYLLHMKSHSVVSNKLFHTCCSDPLRQTETDIPTYQCRICCGQFTSICSLHNHIAHTTGDGSYIFDHSKNLAYPLSLHCAGYENREADIELEGSKECPDSVSVANISLKAEATDDTTLKQVGQFLNKFCTSRCSPDKTESTVRVPKRGRPRLLDHQKKNYVSKTKDKSKTITEKPNSKKKVKLIQNDEVQKTDIKNNTGSTSKKKAKDSKKSSTPRNDKKFANGLDNVNNKSSDISEDTSSAPAGNSNTDTAKRSWKRIKLPKADTTDEGEDSRAANHDTDDETEDLDALSDTTEITDVTYQNPTWTELDISTHGTQTPYDGMDLHSMDIVSIRKHFSVEMPDSEYKYKVRKNSVKVECPHCCKIMLPANLKKHLVCHTEDRPYKCDQCPKTYKRPVHLRIHKNSHQEVKPYYCEFCGKGVLTATMLKQHVMFHHTDNKPFCCSVCDASFITNFKLQRHMKKHTGLKSFQCDLCGMGFATRYNLSVHVRGVHKKDLRFSCDQCEKSFMTNYQLKVHLMKHSGERPYKCAVCKADYVERKELRRHLKKQHNLLMEDGVSGHSEHMSHTDAPTVAEMYTEDRDRYGSSREHKPDMNLASQEVILAGSDSYITFPSIEMSQGAMFCIKSEANPKHSPSNKQLATHSAEVQDYSRRDSTHSAEVQDYSRRGSTHSGVVQDYSTVESIIPGVPLTVSAMNSSYMTVISDRDVVREEQEGEAEN